MWSGSREHGHAAEHAAALTPDQTDAAGELADEQSLAYSADEAAWLFGLERVAPTRAARPPGAVEAVEDHAVRSESSSQVTPLVQPSPGPVGLSPELSAELSPERAAERAPERAAERAPERATERMTGQAAGLELAEPDVATPALAQPAEEPGASPDRSRTESLSAEVTAALLPALDPGPPAPATVAPLDDGQDLPLAARQTLHLHSLGAAPTPRAADVVSLEQQITPPRGTVIYPAAPGTGPVGQPGVGETTASLLLPATAPPLQTLTRASLSRTEEGSLLRHAAGSLLTNLGMGLLGGLLALGGAAAVLSLRGERAASQPTPQAAPQAANEPAPPGLDAATRTRLLQQVTLALASGRRPVALSLLREYAAASPEPAVEELIRILEREAP